jgi:hypothetical protein
MIRGDVTIASGKTVTLRGMVHGALTVQPGARLELPGMLIGDLTVEEGAHVWLYGMLRGQVVNHGGSVSYAAPRPLAIDLPQRPSCQHGRGCLARHDEQTCPPLAAP